MIPITLTKTFAACFYADAGFIVFPLQGKHPLKGYSWSKTEYNPFPDCPGNFGIKLEAEDLVIDVDPRNFTPEKNSWREFLLNCPTLKETKPFSVRTGSGGVHLYYKKPENFPIRGQLKEYPGLEFKTRGQYVVGAGSIHPDTKKVYEIHYGAPGLFTQAPKEMLDLLERIPVQFENGSEKYVEDTQTKERFLNYLKTAPIAIEGQAGDRTTFMVAAIGRDLGLHPDVCLDMMLTAYNPACEPPWPAEDLKKKVYNAYQYASGPVGKDSPTIKFEMVSVHLIPETDLRWDMTDGGRLQKTLRNTTNQFLRLGSPLNDLLAFNEFSGDIIFRKHGPWHVLNEFLTCWNDEEAIRLKDWLSKSVYQFEPNTAHLHEAAVAVASFNRFHPVKEYLNSLKWDGMKRCHDWLIKHLGTEDNEYTRAVGLKTLVAAVARIMEPGCKFEYMTILEGMQGTGKSRSLEVLGWPWFSDQHLDIKNKDTVDAMRGKWIIEVSEMETYRKADDDAMKGFLSRQVDRVRLAYARNSKDFPRQCVFIGTKNREQDADIGYFKDTTGNRRYWPVKTSIIHVDNLRKVRDQLWAEAVFLFNNGTKIFFDDEKLIKMAIEEQKKRLGSDPWFDRIAEWVESESVRGQTVLTAHEIFEYGLGGKVQALTRRELLRISIIMQELNWEKGVFYKLGGGTVRGYKRPYKPEEIE